MSHDQREVQRREHLERAKRDAAEANAFAADVHTALDGTLAELSTARPPATAEAFARASAEIDATLAELTSARASLDAATQALQHGGQELQARVNAEAVVRHKALRAEHERASDRVALLEATLAELTLMRSEILRGR
jgi:hypothetical protein